MAKTEIDLVGELLPVGLLRCKNALELLGSEDVLWVHTDDPSLVAHVTRFLHSERYRVLRDPEADSERPHRIRIQRI